MTTLPTGIRDKLLLRQPAFVPVLLAAQKLPKAVREGWRSSGTYSGPTRRRREGCEESVHRTH